MTIFAETSNGRLALKQRHVGPAVTRTAIAILHAIAWPVRYWIDMRRTMGLLDLDDRMLSDLGVSRCDVAGALYAGGNKTPSARLEGMAHERRRATHATRIEAANASHAMQHQST